MEIEELGLMNKYREIIEIYINENLDILEEIMRDKNIEKKHEYEHDYIIRHDLNINEFVDFSKVYSSIINNSNEELNMYEKNAQDVVKKIVGDLIQVYGFNNLREKQNAIKKEIKYGSFKKRVEKKDPEEINMTNQLRK